MLRVCFISSYPPSRGRLSEYAGNLINELEKIPAIDHIEVIADTSNIRSSTQLTKKLTVHKIWKSDNPISLLFIPLMILKLKPNIVHFNVHMAVFGNSRISNFFGLALPIISRLMGFRTVTTLHNLVEKINLEKVGFKNSFFNRTGSFIILKLIALSSSVTFTLKSQADFFKVKYKSTNVTRIPHGTWINHLNNNHNGRKTKKILYIGHSGPYKDIELLLNTYKLINDSRKNTELIIAGASHPNYPGYLEHFISENTNSSVTFKGYIPEGELPSLFADVDLAVLPYHTCTGTSGVAHLASSFGTPIIATNLPEFQELVAEGCGALLCAHNPQSIANKITAVLDKPILASQLRENSFRFAETRTWNLIANRFYELYEEITK